MLSLQNLLLPPDNKCSCPTETPQPRQQRTRAKSSPITIETKNTVHYRNNNITIGCHGDEQQSNSVELDLASSARSYYFCRGCGSSSNSGGGFMGGTTPPPPPQPTDPEDSQPHPHPLPQQKPPSANKKSRSVDSTPFYSTSPPAHPPITMTTNKPHPITATHTATPTDTLTSIAARYETTPSELLKMNKLMSGKCIFPGMVLRVPSCSSHGDDVFNTESEEGGVARNKGMERKFVKIAVRHVTDGNGVVSGTLLITPNAVMFDPNVSDPLVIEQGAESYGVILPLEVVGHAGIYSDIAMMMVEKTMLGRGGEEIMERPKVYGAKKPHPPPAPPPPPPPPTTKKEKSSLKRLSFPLTWTNSSSNEDLSSSSSTEVVKRSSAPPTASHEKKRDSKSFLDDVADCGEGVFEGGVGGVLRKSFERLLPPSSTTNTTTPTPQQPPEQQNPPPTTTTEENPPEFTSTSASSEWYLLLSTAQPIQPTTRLPLIVSYGQKNYLRPEYWFHIVVKEQVEELYAFWMVNSPETYGEQVDGELLTRRSLRPTTFSTMDLNQTPTTSAISIEKSSSTTSPPNNKESWEMLKSPYYTRLSSLLNRSQTLLTSTSSSATNFGQGLLDSISDFASVENEQEVVSMSEELRAALYGFSNEDLLFILPELDGVSEILDEEGVRELSRHLTPRAEGHPLTLLFTTTTHGFSLATLYRRNSLIPSDTPILLLIKDTTTKIFGALLSNPLKPSDVFYGTGQSFLFTMNPFEVFKWSGDNEYFVKGGSGCASDVGGVVVGAGDGKFGLWLDSDLNCGRSESCATFANPPLVEGNDFVIATLECWGFVAMVTEGEVVKEQVQQVQEEQEVLDE